MGRHEDFERARRAAREICGRLQGAGHVAYLAGGCVRDELLGLEPTDYDVATDATPGRIRGLFRKTSEVGAAFGVMLVRDHGPTTEVATFREEGAYSDRRRPDEVRFSTPEHDARRRDYTVNALFLDPIASAERDAGPGGVGTIRGHVIDFVGGMDDLHAGVIRAVGDPDARLAEDHLRALRAVRLAARLGFEIDPATAGAIRAHASELAGVSVERVGEEVRRMMRGPGRARAVGLVQELGLDAPIFGRASGPAPLATLRALGDGAAATTALAAWAVDRRGGSALEGGIAREWRSALNLSNEESHALSGTLGLAGRFLRDFGGMGVAGRKRLGAAAPAGEALTLASAIDPDAGARVGRELRRLAGDGVGLAPDPVLTGDDLIALGYAPGPGFKGLLDAVYDAQLEGRVSTRDEAIVLAKNEADAHGVSTRGA